MKGKNYNYKLPSIETLKGHYFNEKMSARDISKIYNVTVGAVLIKFRRYNIKRRTLSEAQKLISNYIDLTQEAIYFLNGLLLGDGCIAFTGRRKSCWYSHTDKNKEYLRWLIKHLKGFGIECSQIRKYNNAWSVKTKSYRNFVEIRKLWYPKNKKKIPKIELTPITLFNWYIGDGSYDKKSKSKKIVICSEFDSEGKIYMAQELEKVGINNSIYINAIYIKSKAKDRFFDYITKHKYNIPESYKYKF